jgi:regulator of cell morphogenesis and NO signaling
MAPADQCFSSSLSARLKLDEGYQGEQPFGRERMMMTDCNLDSSVPDWVIEHPETFSFFQASGIDYSCGGKSLECACREAGLDPDTVLAGLLARIAARQQPPQ